MSKPKFDERMKGTNSGKNESRENSHKSANKGKGKRRSMKRDERTMDTPGSKDFPSNPINWYNKYPHLLESASRLAFPYRPGMTITGGFQPSTSINYVYTIPGVCVLAYSPTVGRSTDSVSPISQVAKEIYGQVRASFSSELAVDPPDFVMYLLALDSIFSQIAWLKRVYRVVNTYSPENYALPDQLLLGMGFTLTQIADLRANWIQGWGLINTLINMTRKFKCPAVMDLFNRHYWMNDNVYMDAPTMNAQFYMFNPSVYYTYSETAESTGTSLVVNEMANVPGTWNAMYEAVLAQINALSSSSDAYTISGYLKRAFEGVGDFVVEELQQYEKLQPLYDAVVLMQIENSKCMPVTHLTLGITQDPNTNAVLCTPRIQQSGAFPTDYDPTYELINIHSDNPGVAEVTEATRLTATCSNKYNLNDTVVARDIFCATEIVEGYGIVYSTSTGYNTINMSTYNDTAGTGTASILRQRIQRLCLMSKFDWHPMIYSIDDSGADGMSVLSDFQNVTAIDINTLLQIHRVCLYSEFNAFSII